jgi:hypothetical protein
MAQTQPRGEMIIPTLKNNPDIMRAIEIKNYQVIQQRIQQWEEVLRKTRYDIDTLQGFQALVGELDAQMQLELDSNKAGEKMISGILSSLDQVAAEIQEKIEEATAVAFDENA